MGRRYPGPTPIEDHPWWVEILDAGGHLTVVVEEGTCPQQVHAMVTRESWYTYFSGPDTMHGVQLAAARIRISPKTSAPPNPPLQ